MFDEAKGEGSGGFDVMIIGGGPAGLSAAIWCADLGLKSVLFDEGMEFGGQLGWTFNEIRNYPGFPSITATDLRSRLVNQVASGTTVLIAERVTSVNLAARSAVIEDGRTFVARSVIIATGVRRRRLGLRGEEELLGRGILQSGVGSRQEVNGRHVVIVGGGDAALENAVILSESGARVTLVHRGTAFRARRDFVDAARRNESISFSLSAEVSSILGDERFHGVELFHPSSDERSRVEADFLLIRIGTQPNTEMFARQIEMDARGYIRVAADTSTSVPGVYAIGDAAFPVSPTISTAVGTAAIAVKMIEAATQRRF